MNQKHTALSLLMMFGASYLYAQAPYDHDVSRAEELRVRDGLPNFFQKLKAGEGVTVGYIGVS